jgi:hypothetical protein
MQRPFIHPYAYSIIILLFTIVTAAVFILLLLLLFCYCHYYKTIATDKLLRASLFLGAAELTTHLLRLINILWLSLYQLNKFGFYFPRRLLQSPILVGHHRYKMNNDTKHIKHLVKKCTTLGTTSHIFARTSSFSVSGANTSTIAKLVNLIAFTVSLPLCLASSRHYWNSLWDTMISLAWASLHIASNTQKAPASAFHRSIPWRYT